MSGTEVQRFSDDQSLLGTRWIVALLQAIALSLASALALPVVVISAYVSLATPSLYRIALVPVLAFGLWNLGALVAERICRDRLRLRFWAVGAAIVRVAAMAAIAYFAYHSGSQATDRLGMFFVALGIFGFASGFSSVALDGMLQKSFESSSRAQLFVGRAFWGVISAILAGIVARRVFGNEIGTTPRAFAYLFIAAAGCLASAAFFTLLIKEPVRRLSSARHGRHATLLGVLRQSAMRRYLLFRILFAATSMLDVFIVVYALRVLSIERSFLGIAIIAFSAALAIALPLARSMTARRGGRSVLQMAIWLKLVAPLILLTIPFLQDSASFADRVSGDRVFPWMLGACFAALGASHAFQMTGNVQYLTEIAPVTERDQAFSATNGLLMVTTLASLLGAWILDRWDFQYLFGITAALALLAVLLSGLLVDNRIVVSRPVATRFGRVALRESRR